MSMISTEKLRSDHYIYLWWQDVQCSKTSFVYHVSWCTGSALCLSTTIDRTSTYSSVHLLLFGRPKKSEYQCHFWTNGYGSIGSLHSEHLFQWSASGNQISYNRYRDSKNQGIANIYYVPVFGVAKARWQKSDDRRFRRIIFTTRWRLDLLT